MYRMRDIARKGLAPPVLLLLCLLINIWARWPIRFSHTTNNSFVTYCLPDTHEMLYGSSARVFQLCRPNDGGR